MVKYDETKLNEWLKDIKKLEAERDKINEKLAKLGGFLQDQTPEPRGFDYKDAVLRIFTENQGSEFNIDEIVQQISLKHKFTPDRKKIANRLNYLTDRDNKLARVQGKRGFYRLKQVEPNQQTPPSE